jgi:uncharacterized protein YbjT (DUF2867 family)
MAKTLVLNATGKVSSAVIDSLLAAGHEVVAASRSKGLAPKKNLTQVRFDYADPSTFGPALEGVDRFFWVSPPMVLDGHALSRPFFDKALPQMKKVVLMTANGVDFSDEIPLRKAELHIEKSKVPFTFLRPGWFMDNFHTFWIGSIKAQGVIALPAGDAKSAFIDSRDIAEAAAAVLFRDDVNGKAFSLTGPAALTYAEAAQVLSRAAGRELRYVPLTDADFTAGAVAAGIPKDYAQLLTGLFQAVRGGAAATVTGAVQELTGKAPRTLEAYAKEHAAFFKA